MSNTGEQQYRQTENQDELIKQIPQNIEAEKAVLAAMILDPDIVQEAILQLKETSFFRPSHQKIFSAISDLYGEGEAIDQISLAERLRANGELEDIGGRAYIVELADNSFALANWMRHIEIINRQALLRQLISASTKIAAYCYESPDDTDQVVEQAERLLFDVTDKQIKSTFKSITDLVGEAVQSLNDLAKEQTHMQGAPTGFVDLDKILAGMRGGDFIVLAARPGVGKTSFALNVATNAAKQGYSVAFFSLEMPADQLVQRVMCTEALVDVAKMRRGNLDQQDWGVLIEACDRLSDLDFYIDDSPSLSVLELRAKARRQLHDCEKGLIIVDYLQLMESKTKTNKDRHLEVAEFSRGLKMLAKELKVPIIALAQLSRKVEDRPSKVPQLSDLRESGSIEQDADVVLFIDRSLTEAEASNEKRPPLGFARIIIGKHRNGPTGTVDLTFNSHCTRFGDYINQDEAAINKNYAS